MKNEELGEKKEMKLLLWIFIAMMVASIIIALILAYYFNPLPQ